MERSFSNQGAIHSKARSILLGQRVEKLMKICYNWRMKVEGKETPSSFGVTSTVAVGEEKEEKDADK